MHLLVAGWTMKHKIATYVKILLNSTLLVGEGTPGCVSPAGNSCEFCFAIIRQMGRWNGWKVLQVSQECIRARRYPLGWEESISLILPAWQEWMFSLVWEPGME